MMMANIIYHYILIALHIHHVQKNLRYTSTER